MYVISWFGIHMSDLNIIIVNNFFCVTEIRRLILVCTRLQIARDEDVREGILQENENILRVDKEISQSPIGLG